MWAWLNYLRGCDQYSCGHGQAKRQGFDSLSGNLHTLTHHVGTQFSTCRQVASQTVRKDGVWTAFGSSWKWFDNLVGFPVLCGIHSRALLIVPSLWHLDLHLDQLSGNEPCDKLQVDRWMDRWVKWWAGGWVGEQADRLRDTQPGTPISTQQTDTEIL